jgi:hypothetical protein
MITGELFLRVSPGERRLANVANVAQLSELVALAPYRKTFETTERLPSVWALRHSLSIRRTERHC